MQLRQFVTAKHFIEAALHSAPTSERLLERQTILSKLKELGLEDPAELVDQANTLSSAQGDEAGALAPYQRALAHTPDDDKHNHAENETIRHLQFAKDVLAAQQARAAADAAEQAAAEQAEQARLAAVRVTCCVCEAVPETSERLKCCKVCRLHFGEEGLQWPRYCSSECKKEHWPEHRKVCISKGGGAARGE